MIAVTTTGMTLSIRYSTYSLAALALLGGFLTPLMLSTGQNQPVTLFAYILLLDAGTLLLLRFRHWPTLAAASLAGTIILYAGWHAEYFSDAQSGIAFGAAALFFIFYSLYPLIARVYMKSAETLSDQAVIFGSSAFFFLAFFAQQNWETTWPVKVFTLALAGFEIGMADLIRRRASGARLTFAAFAAASMVLTVAATFLIMEKRWLMPALAAEMAAVGWMGARLKQPMLRFGAYCIGLMALLRFTVDVKFIPDPFAGFTPLFNSRFLVCGATAAAFYLLLGIYARCRDLLQDKEQDVPGILFVITQGLTLVLLSCEVHDFFRFRAPGHVLGWGDSLYGYQLSLSVLWAVYASALTGTGIIKGIRAARILGMLLLGATALKVFLVDLAELETFYRIISFIVLCLLLLAVSYGYNRFKNSIFGGDQS